MLRSRVPQLIPPIPCPSLFADVSGVDRVVDTVAASLCGNGKLDPGEECDDGNTEDDDGCSSQCVIDCYYNCQCHPWDPPCVDARVCGNAVLTSDEECDDGNTLSGDGCSGSCQLRPRLDLRAGKGLLPHLR